MSDHTVQEILTFLKVFASSAAPILLAAWRLHVQNIKRLESALQVQQQTLSELKHISSRLDHQDKCIDEMKERVAAVMPKLDMLWEYFSTKMERRGPR